MCRNQLGRRNLTEEQKSYLRGKQYEAEKMAQGGDRKSEEFSNGQNVHLKNRREIKDGTAGRIGKQYGVNGRMAKLFYILEKISRRKPLEVGGYLWGSLGVVAPPTIPLRCVMSE